jgi:hypothetical protein
MPPTYDPRMTGGMIPGIPPAPNGMYPPRFTMGQYPQGSQMLPGMAFPSASGALPVGAVTDDRSWLPRVVIVVAVFIILVAGAYLVWEILKGDPPPPALQIGKLVIESTPPGAQIYVNNNPVKLETGDVARTPIEQLANLQYGLTYKVQLILEGYKPFETSVMMDEANDGRKIQAVLEGLPAKLTVRIDDPAERDIRIRLNGVDMGLGQKVGLVVNAGRQKIDAEIPGKTCEAIPDNFILNRGESKEAMVHCREGGRPQIATGNWSPPQRSYPSIPRKDPSHTVPFQPERERERAKGECSVPEGLQGFVTINTKPYSEIWFEGKKLGETPLAKVKLPSGCWDIRAVSPDTKQEKKVRIEVQPNKNLRYSFDL